ncbi:MAG: hypothetical protein R3E89_17360 [Thiolinea sp.]
MSRVTGSCLCGAVHYEADAEPMMVMLASSVRPGLNSFHCIIPLFVVEYRWVRLGLWLLGTWSFARHHSCHPVLHATGLRIGLSVVLTGFLYFLLMDHGQTDATGWSELQDFLPTFSTLMAGAVSADEFEQRWQTILHKRFHP